MSTRRAASLACCVWSPRGQDIWLCSLATSGTRGGAACACLAAAHERSGLLPPACCPRSTGLRRPCNNPPPERASGGAPRAGRRLGRHLAVPPPPPCAAVLQRLYLAHRHRRGRCPPARLPPRHRPDRPPDPDRAPLTDPPSARPAPGQAAGARMNTGIAILAIYDLAHSVQLTP